jgi:hypothetical protein
MNNRAAGFHEKESTMSERIPLDEQTRDCEGCRAKGAVRFSRYCGAWVCDECGQHQGLARCYCGWSLTSDNGRTELIEMGETIDELD